MITKPNFAFRSLLLGSMLLASASSLFAQETWDGSNSTSYALGANWADNTAPASGGTTTSRINVNNGAANALYYTSAQGTTIFNPADRALVIGSTTNGSMFITGGTFDSRGTVADILGHQGGTGSLTIDGGSYINTNGGSSVFYMGLAGASTASNLTLSSGNFTTGTLQFGQDANFAASPALVATVQLNGGVLTASTIFTNTGVTDAVISSTINFNGGTLRASSTTTNFMLATSVDNAVVQSNGAIIDTNTFNITIAKALTAGSPSGGLTKQGAGTLTLSGTNSYTGATTVSTGTLALGTSGTINNTSGVVLGGGTFDVSAKASYNVANLSGNGSVAGTINVTTQLAMGGAANAATINFANLALTSGTTAVFDLTGGGSAADLGDVSGTLNLATATLDLMQLGSYTLNDKFTLFAYDGVLSSTFSGLTDGATFTDAGGQWQINYDDSTNGLNGGSGSLYVTVTAIPEPGAALLSGLGMLALLRRRR